MRFSAILLLVLGNVALAQPESPRLIVRGDDMGACHAVNEAIIRCQKDGIQTSIEIIAPSPWFPEAVKMLAEFPAADVGVHLALSSEWDNIKWRPLTNCPSLRDSDGYLYPMIHPNRNFPGRALVDNKWRLDEVEMEFRAQIELAKAHIPQLSHLSGHMGCSGISDEVRLLVQRLAIEYRLDIAPEGSSLKSVGYTGAHKTSAEKIDSFIRMLESLEPGKTYLFVDHPGLDTPEMRAIHHIGYEDVAIDRQGVTDTWTSPRVRDAITARGIQLISYRDLAK